MEKFKICLIYLIVSVTWIFVSDHITASLDVVDHDLVQTYKGLFFMVSTTVMLCYLISKYDKNLRHKLEVIEEQDRQIKKLNSLYKTLSRVNKLILRKDIESCPKPRSCKDCIIMQSQLPCSIVCTDKCIFKHIYDALNDNSIFKAVAILDERRNILYGTLSEESEYLTSIPIKFNNLEHFIDISYDRSEIQDSEVSNLLNEIVEDIIHMLEVTDLRNNLKLGYTIFENSKEGIIIADKNSVIQLVNEAFCNITGYTKEECVGKKTDILKSGKQDKDFYDRMWEELKLNNFWQGEIWNKRKNGELYLEWLQIKAVFTDGTLTNYVAIFSDLSENKAYRERINKLVNYDGLTELPNKRSLLAGVNHIIASGTYKTLTLIYLDIDKFKHINDTLGLAVGDELLINIANKLRLIVRRDDIIARLGTDEFAVVIPNLPTSSAMSISEKLSTEISKPIVVAGIDIRITCSIGIANYPGDGTTAEELVQNALQATYISKSTKAITLFTPEIQTQYDRSHKIEVAIRGLYNNLSSIYLVYQPQLNLKTYAIESAEVLVRWNHSLLGDIPPKEFIPIAEVNESIIFIGEYVLRKALETTKDLPITIAVNVSSTQIKNTNLISSISKALVQFEIPENKLEIELTESVAMENAAKTIDLIENLKMLGVCFSIDDFGTGYSSLSYLRKFKAHKLKIDMSFVQNLEESEEAQKIVKSITNLAKDLGFLVVAEGVETQQQLDFLKSYGCDYIQGYFFSEPLVFKDFVEFIKTRPYK